VRKGEHGTKVYFVKQLQVADRDGEEGKTRIVPMMREYTVFNVDQCQGLPDRVLTLDEVKVRNTDQRDATIDEFLGSSGVEIREGNRRFTHNGFRYFRSRFCMFPTSANHALCNAQSLALWDQAASENWHTLDLRP